MMSDAVELGLYAANREHNWTRRRAVGLVHATRQSRRMTMTHTKQRSTGRTARARPFARSVLRLYGAGMSQSVSDGGIGHRRDACVPLLAAGTDTHTHHHHQYHWSVRTPHRPPQPDTQNLSKCRARFHRSAFLPPMAIERSLPHHQINQPAYLRSICLPETMIG
uniref:Uncharacterized protein n=1 Tax=Plectus sambesii TaxID=2011161 RepID=A0A914WRC7_9BILA